MAERSVVHSTIVIQRRYSASPQRVFNAFSDPNKMSRWFAEGKGTELVDFGSDFRVGGNTVWHFRFTPGTPFPEGTPLTNNTYYLDIVPDKRIVFAYTMAIGSSRISSSQATVELLPSSEGGTELVFTDQVAFFEGGDTAQIREAGWRELLESLARYLEQ